MADDVKPTTINHTGTPEAMKAAFKFPDGLRPDVMVDGKYPAWHGWAIRQAFLAGVQFGIKAERKRAAKAKRKRKDNG